jgi:hypothetical protein
MFQTLGPTEIHHLSALWMTAVIWVVQLNLYPAFRVIEKDAFPAFHESHSARISFLVAAPMLLQLFISAFMLWELPESREWKIHLLIALGIFGNTIFFSIPEHNRLKNGKDLPSIDRLIRTNWYRTGLWTIQSLLILS